LSSDSLIDKYRLSLIDDCDHIRLLNAESIQRSVADIEGEHARLVARSCELHVQIIEPGRRVCLAHSCIVETGELHKRLAFEDCDPRIQNEFKCERNQVIRICIRGCLDPVSTQITIFELARILVENSA
jgi:hypothetical protein